MSKDKDPFFIGWMKKTPKSYTQVVRPFLILLFPLVLLVALLMNFGRRPAENASAIYEFGELTTLEGVLVNKPVPMLQINQKRKGKEDFEHLLLVDAFKFGAANTIDAMETKAITSLINKSIQLKGTLSHFEGKRVLELTEGAAAYIGLSKSTPTAAVVKRPLGNKKLRGEIVDSKCFFGVMKPGSGKTHKSCAVRCLSGGVPAIFKSAKNRGEQEYYLLLGENGESINQDLLAYTADHIQLKGEIFQMANWKIIHTSPSSICPLGPKWLFGDMPLCAD